MRKIQFRGLRTDGKGWVYGSFMDNGTCGEWRYAIFDGKEFIQVNPETVGQLTGLLDKNGKEIYEGDVTEEDDFCRMSVEWYPQMAGWASMFNYSEDKEWADEFPLVEYMSGEGRLDVEVVGNMHESK